MSKQNLKVRSNQLPVVRTAKELTRRVRRGQVKISGMMFRSKELEAYDDKLVVAVVCPDNADEVTIYYEGEFVCVAKFNDVSVFPKTFIEQARAKHNKVRAGRWHAQIDAVNSESHLSAAEKGRIEREVYANKSGV